jgi:hypothetical protein
MKNLTVRIVALTLSTHITERVLAFRDATKTSCQPSRAEVHTARLRGDRSISTLGSSVATNA